MKMDPGERYFMREFEIELDSSTRTLTFFQKEVGDVSCVIWDAALVLSKYLEIKSGSTKSAHWISGKRILELGAGVGCVGLTAACLGGNVVMSDLPDVIELLDKNISANHKLITARGGNASAQVLEWGNDVSCCEKPQLLLLADCVYYQESVEPLVKTMCELTDDNTEILLCQEARVTEIQIQVWKNFVCLLEQHFEVAHIPREEQHRRFFSPDIYLMRLKRKSGKGA